MNQQAPVKTFLVALFVMLLVHSVASIAAYRVFTKTEQFSGSPAPAEGGTPEQAQGGETSFRTVTMTRRSATPLPIYFYIVFGYAGLGAALAIGLFTWMRQQIGLQ